MSASLQDAELRRIGKEYSALGRLVALDEEKCKCEASVLELEQLEKDELKKWALGFKKIVAWIYLTIYVDKSIYHRNTNSDNEMIALIAAEKESCIKKCEEYEMLIMGHLVPKDDDDSKGAVIEVRTGTGSSIINMHTPSLRASTYIQRW